MLNARSVQIFSSASAAVAAGNAARNEGFVPTISVVDGIYGRTYHMTVAR